MGVTAALADNTVYFWTCDADGGICFESVYGYSDGSYWYGSGELTIFGQCTVSGSPQASEAIGWTHCSDSTIDGNLSAWTGYAFSTPNEVGYVISEGVIYSNPGTGAVIDWEGWYMTYCDGTYVKNEPALFYC
jgi:hypothetical protein